MKNATGGPCLWNIGPRWIENGKVSVALALHAGEDLWWSIGVEAFCSVEDGAYHPIRLLCHAVAFEACRANTVVLWPDGAALVSKGIVGRVTARERTDTPAAPHILLQETAGGAARLFRLRDTAPEALSSVRSERGNLLFVWIKPISITALILHPERLVKIIL